jgi:hypothetical protein
VPVPLVVLLAVVVLFTFAAFAWMVRRLFRRLVALGRDLDRLQASVTPALEALERDAAVAGTELEALGDRIETWGEERRTRPRRRWRPAPAPATRGSGTVR